MTKLFLGRRQSIASILTILKYVISLGLFGLLANYLLVAYDNTPEFQQQPVISQVKQFNKTVAERVIAETEERQNAVPLSTGGLRDPFAQ